MSEQPEEPDFNALEDQMRMSPMDQDAVQMHELFQSLIRAGFREKAALYLVAMIVNESMDESTGITFVADPDDLGEDFEDDGKEV
jgi:uncharacterized protein YgfB (UPF0149 family)